MAFYKSRKDSVGQLNAAESYIVGENLTLILLITSLTAASNKESECLMEFQGSNTVLPMHLLSRLLSHDVFQSSESEFSPCKCALWGHRG